MSGRRDAPELVVLGSGAAGFYCALTAAREGMTTVLVERAELGGTAFRWGCLPVKMALDRLKESPGVWPAAQRGAGAGGSRRGGAALPGLLLRVARSLGAVEHRIEDRLGAAGVELLRGAGEFLDERTFRVGERRLRPSHLVIATGTCPAGLPGAPLDGGTVISHRDLFAPVELPGHIAVVGADVEGAELAMLLSALGFRVTVVERLPELLPGLDRDLASPVERRLLEAGVGLELGSPITGVSRGRKGVALALGEGRSVEAGAVLITGIRRPDLPAGLERAGLERAGLDRAGPEHAGLGDSPAEGGGGIPVQPSLATAVPGIYAAGDVNGLLGMAHAAIQQGTLLARSLRTGVPISADHRSSYAHPPRAIYTIPEIGGAGRTERELQAAGAAYRSARVELRDTWRGLCRDPGEGFLKLLADPSGTVLGVWMCAAGAAEASALFGLILERGLQAQELAGALVTHPTVAEALREAALAVGAR